MFIIKHKNFFVSLSALFVVVSITLISVFKLHMGIDFRGGAQLDVAYTSTRPSVDVVRESISKLNLGEAIIQPSGNSDYFIKTRDLSEAERKSLADTLSAGDTTASEKSFTSIGPSVGRELARKSIISIILISLGIILFIAYAFRKVSKPVASWKYGLIAVGTLLHDIMIPVGIFAVLSRVYGVEVDTLFVVALLTVLGLSVSDTIVVFDRIRENIRSKAFATFEETVGRSIEQTYTRSINTSLTVIIVLIALFLFGPTSTKVFSLMMASGMFFGTYSSIFLASPLLVLWSGVKEGDSKKK